jgi:hypothetical protein
MVEKKSNIKGEKEVDRSKRSYVYKKHLKSAIGSLQEAGRQAGHDIHSFLLSFARGGRINRKSTECVLQSALNLASFWMA